MNNDYFATSDENFNAALELVEKPLSHSELMSMLQRGNIPQRQIAALRLDKLLSDVDALILIYNLTGQDGKIREAVSLKINEFSAIPEFLAYFLKLDTDFLTKKYLDAVTDINGNICRNIIESLHYYKNNSEFTHSFNSKLVTLIYSLLDKIKEFDLKDGKYKINKEVFKLYWCLEVLYVNFETINPEDLKRIVHSAKNIEDYTIREKVAKILSVNYKYSDLDCVKNELVKDKNFYVRRAAEI